MQRSSKILIAEDGQDMDERITVIVPCYNAGKTIGRCVDSIKAQTWKNLEIILVDDGSNDGSGSLLDSIAQADSRITVYHTENHGPAGARNTALDHMHGSYVLFCDSDDTLDERMIDTLMKATLSRKADIVACNYYAVYEGGCRVIGNQTDETNMDEKTEDFLRRLFDDRNRFSCPWGKLFRAELFSDVRFPEGIYYGEDMDLAPVLFRKAKKLCYLSDPLYFYSQEGSSLVRSHFSRAKLHMVDAALGWYRFCRRYYPDLEEQAKEHFWAYLVSFMILLARDADFHDTYEKYRRQVRRQIRYILHSRIDKTLKLKAVLIVCLPAGAYCRVHTALKKRTEKND